MACVYLAALWVFRDWIFLHVFKKHSASFDTLLALWSVVVLLMLFRDQLVYLLIVINFQSWSEAFIIITALPAALAGICWMLYLTQTTLSVPALMGTIMSMGVATANSVLIISFANERFSETRDALSAALEAGSTRLRPVIMTALPGFRQISKNTVSCSP